ncbi:MAG TPA: prephenate dehydratase domain-containing protein [Gemmatimonadaceae bacterium]|nr:prephenate dehydratase domain-containing protein [Gemmatimonadaceae bacterium]
MTEAWRPNEESTPLPQPAPVVETTSSLRVAFQGEPGAFSEEAILKLWRGAAEAVPMKSFDDVMDAAEERQVDYGLLPIESTLIGGVEVAYDLLTLHDRLWVTAETVVEIQLSALGLPGATIAGLKTLASHPIMLAQCTYFLDRHKNITPEPAWDTAGAAREVMERGDPTRAAAAGPLAAERFGLVTLAEHIEDRPDTMLRFLAVAPEPAALPPGTPSRTTLLAALPSTTTALLSLVQPFAAHELYVSHLVSRPTREPWRYHFFIEFEHQSDDPRAQRAIEAVKRASTVCRVLGTYPRWVGLSGPGSAR